MNQLVPCFIAYTSAIARNYVVIRQFLCSPFFFFFLINKGLGLSEPYITVMTLHEVTHI